MSLLDLPAHVGQVGATIRWDLLDRSFDVKGDPLRPESGVTMSNDTDATVMRTCSGFALTPEDAARVNIYTDYVRPSLVLHDGSEWPMGVFVLTTDSRLESSGYEPVESPLADLGVFLTAPMSTTFGVRIGESVYEAMMRVVRAYGYTRYDVAPTSVTVGGGPANWPPDASGAQILASLAERAGYGKPYVSNNGTLTIKPLESLRSGDPITYARSDGRVLERTLRTEAKSTMTPNAYKVISSGLTSGEIYGVAYVSPDLPFSKERRGRVVTKVIRRQGLPSTTACVRVAETHARQDTRQFMTAEFQSVIDPRHDTFNVVQLDEDLYREVRWDAELRPGGAHTHVLVKEPLGE